MQASNAAISPFLRKTSGLVKAASTFDVFIFNTGLISIGIGVLYTHLYGPANYPGADIGVASIIATIAMLAVGAGMWAWTVAIPRSGAIYVFVSRGASPALGFALGFVDACCWLFYNAVAAVLFATAGLAPMFVALSIVTGNGSFLSIAASLQKPVIAASFGTALIVLCGFALLIGMRRFFVLQKLMFLVACVGTVALLVALIIYGKSDVAAHLSQVMPGTRDPYNALVDAAARSGLPAQSHSLWQSLRLSVWPFLPLIGGAFSIAIGGEVRDVVRGQARGILGSIALCGVLFAIIGWLSYAAFGPEFQSSVTYLSQNAGSPRLPVTPYFSTLVAILTGNLWLTALICLGFLAWIYFWIPGMLAYAQRVMLASAFDRVAPEALGAVNEKYHTPTHAILLTVAISIVLTWLYACTTFFNTLIFIEAATWAWLVTAIIGVWFPWRRSSLLASSWIGQRRVLGLPLMAVLNALSALALFGMGWLLWLDPLAAGHAPKSMATIAGTFALGLLCFYAMRAYRRRQGLNVDLAYREIPIE